VLGKFSDTKWDRHNIFCGTTNFVWNLLQVHKDADRSKECQRGRGGESLRGGGR